MLTKIFKSSLLVMLVTIVGWQCNAAKKSKNSWKFCVTGDSRGKDGGINSAVLKRIVTELKREQPEYILFVGDLVNGYTDTKKLTKQLTYWRDTFMEPLIDAGIAVYPCRGNHDMVWQKANLVKNKKVYSASASRQVWNQIFSGKFELPQNGPSKEKNITYKIARNNAVVLCLDEYLPKQRHRINQQWFNDEVERLKVSKKQLHLFAFSHEPAYSVRHRDCLDDFAKRRNKLVKTFLDAGGRVMFFGHDHRYNHATVAVGSKTLHQFIIGTAGAPWRIWSGKYANPKVKKIVDATVFGYMLVEINGDQVTMTMKGWGESDKTSTIKIIDSLKYQGFTQN